MTLLAVLQELYLLPVAFGHNGIWLAMPTSESITMLCIWGYYLINKIKNAKSDRIPALT